MKRSRRWRLADASLVRVAVFDVEEAVAAAGIVVVDTVAAVALAVVVAADTAAWADQDVVADAAQSDPSSAAACPATGRDAGTCPSSSGGSAIGGSRQAWGKCAKVKARVIDAAKASSSDELAKPWRPC